MTHSHRSRNRRLRLIANDPHCFYCKRETSAEGPKNLFPVLEHFVPRAGKGKMHDTVLACAWCDSAKGMMHGADFQALIRRETACRSFLQAMGDIKRKAKSINVKLFRVHPPNKSQRSAA